MIEKIKALKKSRNTNEAIPMVDSYTINYWKNDGYNEAIEDVIKILNLHGVSGSFTLDDMRKAFLAGRDSIDAELRYYSYTTEQYATKVIKKSFKTFIHENYR